MMNANPPALFEATYLSSKNNTMVTIGVPEPVGDCQICLESFDQNGRMVATCEAKHRYHKECLSAWFETELLHNRSINTCPTCRNTFPNISKAFHVIQKSTEIVQEQEQEFEMVMEKIRQIWEAQAEYINRIVRA